MRYETRNYRISATKRRDGSYITGTTQWDGLSSIYSVRTENGDVAYVSVLDEIHEFRECPRVWVAE